MIPIAKLRICVFGCHFGLGWCQRAIALILATVSFCNIVWINKCCVLTHFWISSVVHQKLITNRQSPIALPRQSVIWYESFKTFSFSDRSITPKYNCLLNIYISWPIGGGIAKNCSNDVHYSPPFSHFSQMGNEEIF